jgi:hypothetical protein
MREVRAPGGIDLDNVSAQQELYTLLRGGGALIEASHREGRETTVNAPFFYIAGLLPDLEMIRLDQHVVAIILACLGVDGHRPTHADASADMAKLQPLCQAITPMIATDVNAPTFRSSE